MGKGRATTGRFATRGRGAALLLAVLAFGSARSGRAHILMTAPDDWLVTNSEGDPQKVPPCGVDPSSAPSASTYTPTNKVTTLHVGDQITFSWTETVPHDGHFRISLAVNSRSELTDPAVTASNADGTPKDVAISTAYPVLADNLFPHQEADTPIGMKYSYTVTIPNTPCTKCTLQLLQFMAEHPADPSYFYHHCADVTILPAEAPTDAGASGTPGAGGTTPGAGGTTATAGGSGGNPTAVSGPSPLSSSTGGCSCRTASGGGGFGGLLLAAVASLIVRRRRRAGR